MSNNKLFLILTIAMLNGSLYSMDPRTIAHERVALKVEKYKVENGYPRWNPLCLLFPSYDRQMLNVLQKSVTFEIDHVAPGDLEKLVTGFEKQLDARSKDNAMQQVYSDF